jgi:orotidine-5'-phosphate decarboxylase
MPQPAPHERLIVALDTPDVARAAAWIRSLQGAVGAFKVGLEFLHAAGPAGVRTLQEAGAGQLFVDCKLADIPNTVAGAVRSLCALRPWLLNVHAMCGAAAMAAARRAAEEEAERLGTPRPRLLAVTVLTSLDAPALAQVGFPTTSPEDLQSLVVRLALLAGESGMDGVVASPREVAALRAACGPEFLLVTPGVRPAGSEVHDQARVATPAAAVAAGADYLVLGRAITGAEDPRAAAERIAATLPS